MKKEKSFKLLILTEAGDNIGLGHYTRCVAIQNEIKERGGECKLILDLVGKYNLDFDGLGANWIENKEIVKEFWSKGYNRVLIDSYLATIHNYKDIATSFERSYVMDDYNRIVYPDGVVIINPNVYVDSIDYSNQNTLNIHGGRDYVILRKAFRNDNLPSIRNEIKKVLITIGGSDYRKIVRPLISIVTNCMPDVDILVIAEKSMGEKELTDSFPKVSFWDFGLTATEMYEKFYDVDVVISACGQTLHELASMGKPVIGICIDKDQELNQQFYREIGFLQEKNNYTELSSICEQLEVLVPIEKRKALQKIGINAVNINGLSQIVNLLMN